MRNRVIWIAVALTACSGSPGETASVTPEPPAASAAPEPTQEPPTAAPEPPVQTAVPADRTYSVITMPPEVRLEALPVRGADRTITGDEFTYGEVIARWEIVQHPDPATRAAISAWARANVDRILGEGNPVETIRCRMRLANANAVAMVCDEAIADDRGDGYYAAATFMAKIDGGRLVPFEMTDALIPRQTIDRMFDERCEQRARRGAERGEAPDVNPCTGRRLLFPDNAGVGALYESGAFEPPLQVTLTWSELADVIRADGPLASLLPSTGTREIVVTGAEQLATRLALSCVLRFDVSAPHPLAEVVDLVRRAGTLDGEDEIVTCEVENGQRRLLLRGCVDTAEEANALAGRASALGTRLGERVQPGERACREARIMWMRVERSLSLRDRAARDGAWRATLPAGALVPAVLDETIDGTISGAGHQGSWARVFPTATRDGWSAGRYLQATERRPPDAAIMLANVPEAQRASAARDALMGDLAPPGTATPLWFVAASSAEPAVYVGIAPGTPEGGPPATAPRLSRAAGTFEEIAFVRSPADAPTAYALVGTRVAGAPDGMVRFQLFAPGAAEAGWTLDAPTGASIPERARATYETGVTRDRVSWLVEMRLPDGAVVRVRDEGGRFVEAR